MEFFITSVPVWVSFLFILVFPVAAWLVASAAHSGYLAARKQPVEAKILRNRILLFYSAFLFLVATAALLGAFSTNTLPPVILLCTTLPLVLFYFFYVSRTTWFRTLLAHTPLADLVGIHLFRFVGIFFLINHYYGSLPQPFAFVGGWGDIISASLAVWVVFALRQKKSYAIPLTWGWNIIGMIDILNVLVTAIVTTREAIADGTSGVAEFGSFPFAWIPAFAPATIIFLHVVVFRRLIALQRNPTLTPASQSS